MVVRLGRIPVSFVHGMYCSDHIHLPIELWITQPRRTSELYQRSWKLCREKHISFRWFVVFKKIYLNFDFPFSESLANDTLFIIFCLVLISWTELVSAEHRIILVVLCGNTLSLLYTIAFLVISNSHAISMGEDVLMIVTGMGNVQVSIHPITVFRIGSVLIKF